MDGDYYQMDEESGQEICISGQVNCFNNQQPLPHTQNLMA